MLKNSYQVPITVALPTTVSTTLMVTDSVGLEKLLCPWP